MFVLITGGAGVVGRSLCREFLSQGHQVRVLVLPNDPGVSFLPSEVEIFYGDVSKKETMEGAFQNIDFVCHLAAVLISKNKEDFHRVNYKGTENILELSQKAQVKKIIFISSISVIYPIRTPYAESKYKSEQLIKNSKIPYVILRPTLVVEKTGGVEYQMFVRYVRRMPILFLPRKGLSLKRPVRTADLVKGIVLASLSDKAINQTYALGGADVLSLAQMAKGILKNEGKHKPIVSIPWFLCRWFAFLKSFFGASGVSPEQALAGFRYDAAPSIEEARIDFGYKPQSVFDLKKEESSI